MVGLPVIGPVAKGAFSLKIAVALIQRQVSIYQMDSSLPLDLDSIVSRPVYLDSYGWPLLGRVIALNNGYLFTDMLFAYSVLAGFKMHFGRIVVRIHPFCHALFE